MVASCRRVNWTSESRRGLQTELPLRHHSARRLAARSTALDAEAERPPNPNPNTNMLALGCCAWLGPTPADTCESAFMKAWMFNAPCRADIQAETPETR